MRAKRVTFVLFLHETFDAIDHCLQIFFIDKNKPFRALLFCLHSKVFFVIFFPDQSRKIFGICSQLTKYLDNLEILFDDFLGSRLAATPLYAVSFWGLLLAG